MVVLNVNYIYGNNTLTVADPGGATSVRPLWVQILSFWHTNFSKCSHLGSWRPLTRSAPPIREIMDPLLWAVCHCTAADKLPAICTWLVPDWKMSCIVREKLLINILVITACRLRKYVAFYETVCKVNSGGSRSFYVGGGAKPNNLVHVAEFSWKILSAKMKKFASKWGVPAPIWISRWERQRIAENIWLNVFVVGGFAIIMLKWIHILYIYNNKLYDSRALILQSRAVHSGILHPLLHQSPFLAQLISCAITGHSLHGVGIGIGIGVGIGIGIGISVSISIVEKLTC